MFDAGPLSADTRGVRLGVRVTPRAGADEVGRIERDADDRLWLTVRVRALPDKGAANASVAKTVAKALGVAKTTISVLSGSTSRNKVLLIEGDTADLMVAVQDFLEERA